MEDGPLRRDMVVPRMERLLERLAGRRHVRHAVLGVATLGGEWSWSGATGAAHPDGTPMRADTPWFLASVTKLYITAVVLRLLEQGTIRLDEPIGTYLPDEFATGLHVRDGVDSTDRITVTHLLGHLSGLPDWLDERPAGERSFVDQVIEGEDRAWTFVEAVRWARDRLAPNFAPSDPAAPRARIRYSDTNFQVLMVMAENVVGRPMAEIYRELLFEPQELAHTWMPADVPAEPSARPATVWIGNRPLDDHPLALRSFADLYASVADVLRFGRALFGGQVFEQSATGELMGRRFRRFGPPRSAAAVRAPSWPIEYGLGLMRFDLPRLLAGGRRLPPLIGHTGSTGSWLWYCPTLGLLLAGTVDQATAAAVPFRVIPRYLAGLGD